MSLHFKVDTRVELIAIIEYLATGIAGDQGPSAYHRRIEKYFPAKHPAVERFKKMSKSDWRHRHPSLILLDFSEPPELQPRVYKDHYSEAGSQDAVAAFIPLLRRFVKDTKFMEFFRSEEARYAAAIERATKSLGKFEYEKDVEDYLGVKTPHRYFYVFAPMYWGEGNNVLYHDKDGTPEVFSIHGANGTVGGEPSLTLKAKDIADTVWHEVAHTVVDDWTLSRLPEIEPLSPLYAMMTGIANSQYQGPPGWPHIFDEHVIRAFTSRMGAVVYDEAYAARLLKEEREKGFVLVGAVYEALRIYEKRRDEYKTLGDFYPRMIDIFGRAMGALERAKAATATNA